jgi:hypothetical protein
MKPIFIVGIAVLVLGIASLFYAIPNRERHGVRVGGADIGIETTDSRKLSPIVSAVMILAGAGLMLSSRGGR